MAFSPKGVIWVLSIFERIRLSRYCAAIRERNSCLYRICKKNIFCSKYMINIAYHLIFSISFIDILRYFEDTLSLAGSNLVLSLVC